MKLWMAVFIVVACAYLAVFAGCSSRRKSQIRSVNPGASAKRTEHPAGKGMELISWKPKGEDWHFSLVRGTNRRKSVQEITDAQVVTVGVDALKNKLSRLAVGEQVVWRHLGEGPEIERVPYGASSAKIPPRMVRDVQRSCRLLGIRLDIAPQ